ncbi:MAG: hypothetical protein EBX39_09010 [Actinobacteria bacterium]|nr:hypothetical protein [Actinomycetota bacterium]
MFRTKYFAYCKRRWHLYLEHWRDYCCDHSESHHQHNLYGNGNQQQWMYGYSEPCGNGECESNGEYWWRKFNLRRTEYYAYCKWRRYLCLEYWSDYCWDYGESHLQHNLYCYSYEQQWMYCFGQ